MTDSTHGASKGWAVAGMVLAVLFWGTQFPLSQHVLQSIDQYYFGVLRYGIGVALFALTLAWREGANAFSLRGRAVEIAWLGICGFTVFGLLAFWALYHTSPAHVSIILSSQPMVTALWLWVGYGRRPAAHTFVCLLVELGGLALIITRGDVGAALAGGSLMGDALALVAMAGWIVYTLGAQRFPGFSPLRFTTLTCIAGTAGSRQLASESALLRVAALRDGLESTATYAISRADYARLGLAWYRYETQAGTALGYGTSWNLEVGSHLRIEYPNLTLRLYAAGASYADRGGLDTQLAGLLPAAVDPANLRVLPQNDRLVGLSLGLGTVIENTYSRAWRPFAEIGITHSQAIGNGYNLRGGIAGSVLGQDLMTLRGLHVSGTAAAPRGSQEVGLDYQWFF